MTPDQRISDQFCRMKSDDEELQPRPSQADRLKKEMDTSENLKRTKWQNYVD